jgi:hypothetical protein
MDGLQEVRRIPAWIAGIAFYGCLVVLAIFVSNADIPGPGLALLALAGLYCLLRPQGDGGTVFGALLTPGFAIWLIHLTGLPRWPGLVFVPIIILVLWSIDHTDSAAGSAETADITSGGDRWRLRRPDGSATRSRATSPSRLTSARWSVLSGTVRRSSTSANSPRERWSTEHKARRFGAWRSSTLGSATRADSRSDAGRAGPPDDPRAGARPRAYDGQPPTLIGAVRWIFATQSS